MFLRSLSPRLSKGNTVGIYIVLVTSHSRARISISFLIMSTTESRNSILTRYEQHLSLLGMSGLHWKFLKFFLKVNLQGSLLHSKPCPNEQHSIKMSKSPTIKWYTFDKVLCCWRYRFPLLPFKSDVPLRDSLHYKICWSKTTTALEWYLTR